MATTTSDVTSEGQRLIDAWLKHEECVWLAESELTRAKRNAEETKVSLAKWLLPDDAKFGEKIAIWHGDSLIQVEVETGDHYHVTVRKRGRALRAA